MVYGNIYVDEGSQEYKDESSLSDAQNKRSRWKECSMTRPYI